MIDKCLFAFDVDGTLLNDRKNVLNSTRKSIDSLLEKGHVVCLATGRTPIQTIDLVHELNLKHFIIGSGGATIYNISENKLDLICNPLSKKDLITMWKIAKKFKRELGFNDGSKLWRVYFGNNPSKEINDELFFRGGTSKNPIYDPIKNAKKKLLSENIIQVSLKMESSKIEENKKEISKKLSNNVDYHITSQVYFEVSQKGINKFNAIKFLENLLNIKNENTYCFGDSHNDFEMIKYSGNGIAMGNAIDEIKNIAKYTIGNNNSDSIFNFLLEQKLI